MTMPPDRRTIGDQIRALLAGEVSREHAADWAARWVVADEPVIDDPIAWRGLQELAGVDLKVNPTEYLHGDDDVRAWLKAVEDPDVK